MREETKAAIRLAVKRWFLLQARNIVWRADEWIHKHEQQLRDERISVSLRMESARAARPEGSAVQSAGAQPDDEQLPDRISRRVPRVHQPERFAQTDVEPFPQMELLADDIGAETDSPSRAGQRQLRAKAERASAETRSASPSWVQIKQENTRRRDSHRRPLWMVG